MTTSAPRTRISVPLITLAPDAPLRFLSPDEVKRLDSEMMDEIDRSIDLLHPTQQLFEALQQLGPYPKGVVAVPEQIQGTCFFPGGTGLWHGQTKTMPEFPIGGVMVLGHDFHSVLGYERSRQGGSENLRSPTWRQLTEFLARVPIALERCFFTNAYMGLREGAATTGKFPGAASPPFVQLCGDFMLRQIAVQQPSLILALGNYVPAFLAPLSPQLAAWSKGNFRDRDARDIAIRSDVSFIGSPAPPCMVVSMLHPSFRPSNVRHRRWKELSGDEAEIALVREAWRLAYGVGAAS